MGELGLTQNVALPNLVRTLLVSCGRLRSRFGWVKAPLMSAASMSERIATAESTEGVRIIVVTSSDRTRRL